MKKSALLAVSALSLGVVGLATFTPVVNAVSSSTNANVSVTISGTLGVGNDESGSAQSLDVAFGSIAAGDPVKTVPSTIKTTNNTGSAATLTVKDADTETALVSGGNKIPAGATIQAGTSAWGISVNNDDTYAAMPSSDGGGLPIGSDGAATSHSFTVKYGLSTSATQAAGTYSDEIVYTFTAE